MDRLLQGRLLLIHAFSNPKGYADGSDARQYDPRLRPPVRDVELEIDPDTGMKNYIANEKGDWATSSGYVKYSLSRSIHYGRLYTRGRNTADLCEALRLLGQGLHTAEDFAAHTNYCELALREMGFLDVFPHTGRATEMNICGRRAFPLVTGTFGMVDFLHSMLGEATDHVTQSEVTEMDVALGEAENNSTAGALGSFASSLKGIPGTGELVSEAGQLKRNSDAQEASNRSGASEQLTRASFFESTGVQPPSSFSFDPQKTMQQIYPILEFRDKVVRKITAVVEKFPALEALVERISEKLSIFIMSLLAPFIRPIIQVASHSLQNGSSGVLHASSKHQFEPWADPFCTDPTHSLLSKDHFANVLNEPAGNVASAILKYIAPRVLYAWEHPNVSEQEVMNDCLQVFHHPVLRDMRNEAHRTMFEIVVQWVHARKDGGNNINDILSAEGVKSGKNSGGQVGHSHDHTATMPSFHQFFGSQRGGPGPAAEIGGGGIEGDQLDFQQYVSEHTGFSDPQSSHLPDPTTSSSSSSYPSIYPSYPSSSSAYYPHHQPHETTTTTTSMGSDPHQPTSHNNDPDRTYGYNYYSPTTTTTTTGDYHPYPQEWQQSTYSYEPHSQSQQPPSSTGYDFNYDYYGHGHGHGHGHYGYGYGHFSS